MMIRFFQLHLLPYALVVHSHRSNGDGGLSIFFIVVVVVAIITTASVYNNLLTLYKLNLVFVKQMGFFGINVAPAKELQYFDNLFIHFSSPIQLVFVPIEIEQQTPYNMDKI